MLASAQQDLEDAVHELDDVLKDCGAALPPDLRVRLERSRALIVSACDKLGFKALFARVVEPEAKIPSRNTSSSRSPRGSDGRNFDNEIEHPRPGRRSGGRAGSCAATCAGRAPRKARATWEGLTMPAAPVEQRCTDGSKVARLRAVADAVAHWTSRLKPPSTAIPREHRHAPDLS